MRGHAFFAFFVLLAACSDLKHADSPSDGGASDPSDGGVSTPSDPGGPVQVTVEPMISGRSRLGARSSAGFRPWRTGVAVHDGKVYWVESGTKPGLYAAPFACSDASCVETVATLTRPSSFTADATAMLIADTTKLQRFPFTGGGPTNIASATDDIVNVASDGTNAFWTSGTAQDIQRTTPSGTTSAIIYSNGTPVGMAVAGSEVFWAGVDISGQIGALQAVGTDGSGAREVSRFSGGFEAMQGNGSYLYYGKGGSPGELHRITLATGHDEVLDRDAYGVTDIAVDDTYAYWTEPGDGPDYANGRVRRIAHAATTAETLAVSVALPVALAASGNTVFVASAGTKGASYADGQILRLTIAP
jgi:hypothetical protein